MGVVMGRTFGQRVLIGLMSVSAHWALADEANLSVSLGEGSSSTSSSSISSSSTSSPIALPALNLLTQQTAPDKDESPVTPANDVSEQSSSFKDIPSSFSSSESHSAISIAASSLAASAMSFSSVTSVSSLDSSTSVEGAESSAAANIPDEGSASSEQSSSVAMAVDTAASVSAANGGSEHKPSLLDSGASGETTEPTLTLVEEDGIQIAEPEPEPEELPTGEIEILGQKVPPGSYRRLTWSSDSLSAGFSEPTPVLVVNGANPGPTLCLVGAIHGDELNGVEMIRSVIFDIDPSKLKGAVVGVPVANIMGFRRNSRYLPDRRDWNRYFPGNTHGSTASRLAHSFFNSVIIHCDSLVDIHTGSFHRTNLPQLRADLSDGQVAKFAQSFGEIAVLNSRGNPSSLRAAALRAGIPAVTMEAGEPQHLQPDVVAAGVTAIKTLLAKNEMYGRAPKWGRVAPVYYRSSWIRANQSGILFSRVHLGKRVREGDILGTITDPITNARTNIISPFNGRVLGMALDQVVLPGFAAYHIGVQTAEQILIEESQIAEGISEIDEEDGDDAGVIAPAETSSSASSSSAASESVETAVQQ